MTVRSYHLFKCFCLSVCLSVLSVCLSGLGWNTVSFLHTDQTILVHPQSYISGPSLMHSGVDFSSL